MANTSRIKLGTYGTLKRGNNNHHMLGKDIKVVAENVRLPKMSLYDLDWFPAAVRDDEGPGVVVDIYEIPVVALRNIDYYEGFVEEEAETSLFVRELEVLENGEEILIYLFNRPLPEGAVLVPSGKWEN